MENVPGSIVEIIALFACLFVFNSGHLFCPLVPNMSKERIIFYLAALEKRAVLLVCIDFVNAEFLGKMNVSFLADKF